MAQPARKRRPQYPPDVIDITAPQLPLIDSKPHTPPPHHTTTTTRARALTAEESVLATALRDQYKFRGAKQFIIAHGFDNVAWAIEMASTEEGVKHPGRFIRWLLDTAEERAG
jgi:hypothetical protein